MSDLHSGDHARIRDALGFISASGDHPGGRVMGRVIELMSYPNPEIRQTAILAAALHWRERAAFPPLVMMLGQENVPDVCATACKAIGVMGQSIAELTPIAINVLAEVVLNEATDPAVREIAYLGLLGATQRVSARQRAAAPSETRRLDVDWKWVRQIREQAV